MLSTVSRNVVTMYSNIYYYNINYNLVVSKKGFWFKWNRLKMQVWRIRFLRRPPHLGLSVEKKRRNKIEYSYLLWEKKISVGTPSLNKWASKKQTQFHICSGVFCWLNFSTKNDWNLKISVSDYSVIFFFVNGVVYACRRFKRFCD